MFSVTLKGPGSQVRMWGKQSEHWVAEVWGVVSGVEGGVTSSRALLRLFSQLTQIHTPWASGILGAC